MAKVIITFHDDKDGGNYKAGDIYPRAGVTPTKERMNYLASNKNKLGRPVIELIKEMKPKKDKKEGEAETVEE